MKTKKVTLFCILCLTVLIILGSCATKKKTYVSSDYVLQELSGTWENEEYENTLHVLKDGGYTKEIEPCHINNFRENHFFYNLNNSEKQKFVENLYNINKSRKTIKKKLFKL